MKADLLRLAILYKAKLKVNECDKIALRPKYIDALSVERRIRRQYRLQWIETTLTP